MLRAETMTARTADGVEIVSGMTVHYPHYGAPPDDPAICGYLDGWPADDRCVRWRIWSFAVQQVIEHKVACADVYENDRDVFCADTLYASRLAALEAGWAELDRREREIAAARGRLMDEIERERRGRP